MMEESDILRTIFDDNYISLLPGESKTIFVSVYNNNRKPIPRKIHFEISGLNCSYQQLEAVASEK